nr:DUF4350 domain-containing protein [Agromyces marinus]
MSAGARPAEAITPGLRASLGHRRAWIAIAAVLVAGAVLLVVLQGAVRPPGAPLASDNAAPDGAQALVRVLEAGGVEVEAVRSLDAAIDAGRGRATVFLHDDAGLLDRDRIRELAGSVDRIVVARPDFAALEVLAPGCASRAAHRTGSTRRRARSLPPSVRAGSPPGSSCSASTTRRPQRDSRAASPRATRSRSSQDPLRTVPRSCSSAR